MFILFVGYFSVAEGRLSPVLRWKSSTVSHGFPYIVSIYYITFYLFVLKILDVRRLPYGPRLTGPSFKIFLWARTSQNLARKADTPRHTGPT